MFYSIGNKFGIMVWPDFMFGTECGINAKLNIEAEAEDQLCRLRNHPS